MEMGQYKFYWNALGRASGIYIIQIIIDQNSYQSKVILLK